MFVSSIDINEPNIQNRGNTNCTEMHGEKILSNVNGSKQCVSALH